MDKHDVAHYGIAGAVVAALGAGFYTMPHTEKTWPDLTSAQALSIVRNAHKAIPDETLNVYCADRECNKLVKALRDAAASDKIKFHSERPFSVPDGPSVGAKTQETADQIAKAVSEGSDSSIKPMAVPGQPLPYISFGHFADGAKADEKTP